MPSYVHRFRITATYLSKVANFSYPRALGAPLEYYQNLGIRKLENLGY